MIDLICEISKPDDMLEMNINNIYLLFNIGLKHLMDNEDDIGEQIKNLKTIEYKFNVNEIFVFRTFLNNKVILYKPMENQLYILNSTTKIINVVSYIDNYIVVFYENNMMEIINYKDFSFILIQRNTYSPEDYISLSIKVIEEDLLKDKKTVKKNIKPILLPSSKIVNKESITIDIPIDTNCLNIICERIWCLFALQEKTCYCYSIIENNQRLFKYLTNINNKNIIFDNIFELITFLKKEFYEPLKLCSFLV